MVQCDMQAPAFGIKSVIIPLVLGTFLWSLGSISSRLQLTPGLGLTALISSFTREASSPNLWPRPTSEIAERGWSQFQVPPAGTNEWVDTGEIDFTLVTQSTLSRLWVLPHLCDRWSGPIILVVFALNATERAEAMARGKTKSCKNLDMLLVDPPANNANASDPMNYPLNALRNMGIKRVRTSHYLVIDMDLWPSSGIYQLLRTLSAPGSSHAGHFADPLRAFVVPAFERRAESGRAVRADEMPGSLDDLEACLRPHPVRRCSVFYFIHWFEGHSSTDTPRWLASNRAPHPSIYQIKCFDSNFYEPYVVVRKGPGTPLYAEVFTGYGRDKIQQVVHMRLRGFSFMVLPHVFLIHYPHAYSAALRTWMADDWRARREARAALFERFVEWATEESVASGRNVTTQVCPPHVLEGKLPAHLRAKRQQAAKKLGGTKSVPFRAGNLSSAH